MLNHKRMGEKHRENTLEGSTFHHGTEELSKTTSQTERKRIDACYLDGRVGGLAGDATWRRVPQVVISERNLVTGVNSG